MGKIVLIVLFLMSIIVIGLVMDRDSVTSIKERAEQGDADAQYNLGYMYSNGDGVTKNDKVAVKWTRRAAKEGYEDGKRRKMR